MSRIQKLPDALANKIAAGEVVQRPESVIKELVENSLDAGATQVAVVVRNAGKALMFVSDNGSGMSEEDARLAFERHATSKIVTAEDLDRIRTLGFRGEAMAAIAAVAQVELKTRQAEDELGTMVRAENGAIVEVGPTACDAGTSIAVKNLFFSVPARRKFLKSNATELKHIVEVMQRFALCYPQVKFTLSDGDSLVLNVEAGTIEDRISAIYNAEMMNALLPLEADGIGIRATGFIGRPNFARRSKSDQYLFLNGRHIRSKLLSHAIFTGYEHLMDAQSYPPYVVFLEIDPERVDVNVHPTKAEVKFDDENSIYQMLQAATRATLSQHNLTPAMRMPNSETGEDVVAALRFALPQYDRPQRFPDAPVTSRGERPDLPPEPRNAGAGMNGDLVRQLFADPFRDAPAPPPPEAASDAAVAPSSADEIDVTRDLTGRPPATYRQERRPLEEERGGRGGLWQVHNKYILSQIRSGLMIVDQHVAHERILYEQALRMMESAMPMSQQLLFALEMKVAPTEYALVRELRQELTALGFELALDHPDTIIVHGVPNDVRPGQEADILRELIDQYHEYQHMGMTDQRDLVAASFACRAAIKAGDPLSEPEMLNLIEQLFSTSMPYVCPHGRPIVIRVDLAELDRRFGRT